MDTRLLRVWSNDVYESEIVGKILTVLLLVWIFLMNRPVLAAPRTAQSQVAISDIRVIWNQSANHFSGIQLLAIPSSMTQEAMSPPQKPGSSNVAFDFWMLPNRDLQESAQRKFTRDDDELKNGAQAIEWPYSDVGLGTLLVREVSAASRPLKCPTEQGRLVQISDSLKWQQLAFERHESERQLRIEVKSDHAAQCYFLMIQFIFEPRVGEGNFALERDGNGHFSGPFFPLWKSTPVFTRLRFKSSSPGLSLQCTGCRQMNQWEETVSFVGLPPAFSFNRTNRNGADLLKIESSTRLGSPLVESEKVDGEVSRTVELFFEYARPAMDRLQRERSRTWQTTVRLNVLLEKLVAEQGGEVQLHSSFGQVSPILAIYHRAALFRALARDYLRFALETDSKEDSWELRRDNEFIARLVSEMWLIRAFPKLGRLREISDDLSFLPFFRAIQQGNAFLNNSVFVGSEERPGQLDFHLFHEFYAPLTGHKILERLRMCVAPDVQKDLDTLVQDLAAGKTSISEVKKFVTTTSVVSDCVTPVRKGLIFETLPEEQIELNSEKSNLLLTRKILSSPPSFDFFFGSSRKNREPLGLLIRDRNGTSEQMRILPEDADEVTLQLPAHALQVQVQEPNRAVSGERLQWPRPLRAVLQALALNYDSRRSDLALRSQLQATQTGDEWGRALLLGYRREFSKNNIDLGFSTRTPSAVPSTSGSLFLGSNLRLEKSPPAFLSVSYGIERGGGSLLYPDGMGLKLWLRRPLSLSALQEKMAEPQQEWIFNYATALAPRLTWSETISYGASDTGIDVGLRSVPAWPADEFISNEYGYVRSELRQTLTQNFNVSLAKSILFQHAVLYTAHVFAFDRLQTERSVSLDARVAQSLVLGTRFFGALFGAKDQAIAIEVSRAMTSSARTSFGFSLGKAMN